MMQVLYRMFLFVKECHMFCIKHLYLLKKCDTLYIKYFFSLKTFTCFSEKRIFI